MLVRVLAVAAFFLVVFPAAAEPVSTGALRRHIDVLASDAFEGREPGTEGEQKAIAYIAGQMRSFGLEPGGPGNSWYQPLEVAVRRPGEQSSVWQTRGGRRERIELGRDEIILLGRSARETLTRAPVIFAGHGAVIPDRGIDQLAGADLKGAVVLILYDEPGTPGFPGYPERVQAVAAAGAAAVIGIIGPELPWPVVLRTYESGSKRLSIDSPPPLAGAISQAAAETLLRSAGTDLAALLAAPGPSFAPVPLKLRASLEVATAIETIRSSNVIGRIRGSGGGGESLLYLAHWDHLGQCEPEAKDRICNGAVDNASGIAALIEAAGRLAAGEKPKRDILILATTAEESGLLGAETFARNPPVPRQSIVAGINVDTLAVAPAGTPVAVIGGNPQMDLVIGRVALGLGRKLDADREADIMATRQDGHALSSHGIPTFMAVSNASDMSLLRQFLSSAYHRPADEPDAAIEYGGAVEDTNLLVALARAFADPAQYAPPARQAAVRKQP